MESDIALLFARVYASFFLDERLHRMSAGLPEGDSHGCVGYEPLLRAMAVRYALSISGSELPVAVVRACQ